uniref:GRIP domain-containing protein n=2 Tax=Photinus pyralis TaxID=7054 RepID=A0A1Y1NAG1_PHOPY
MTRRNFPSQYARRSVNYVNQSAINSQYSIFRVQFEMSGDVCQHHQQAKTQSTPLQSKIPISSPSQCGTPRTRVRLGGESVSKTVPKALQRGHSFMESGEKNRSSHGLRPSGVAPRPQSIKTEPRNSVALNRATGVAPHTPTRMRSLSLSISNARVTSPKSSQPSVPFLPKTPPSSPNDHNRFCRDWDLDSLTSSISCLSVASCDHASVAHNGTTYSGRSKKYVVHCSEHSGATGGDYLTPTQRAHRQIKRLKQLLHQTQKDLDLKDTDILKLTKEVVELRLYKAALHSPEDKSNSSSDGVTVREIETDGSRLHAVIEKGSSCADSGHYEDLCNSSVHSKESVIDEHVSPYKVKTTADVGISVDLGPRDVQSEHQRLVVEYERRLQELVRNHEEECHQMKRKHNDKVDELLQRLSDVNARYWELVPDLDSAKQHIKELEQQLEDACKKLEEEEKKHKESYLQMYNKGQEAAKFEHVRQISMTAEGNTRVSVPELLHQLEETQNELEKVKAMYRQLLEARNKNKIDPEITLQFLKSAIYYFLTDKENNQGHLRAIQSILGFTPSEISTIDKARMT